MGSPKRAAFHQKYGDHLSRVRRGAGLIQVLFLGIRYSCDASGSYWQRLARHRYLHEPDTAAYTNGRSTPACLPIPTADTSDHAHRCHGGTGYISYIRYIGADAHRPQRQRPTSSRVSCHRALPVRHVRPVSAHSPLRSRPVPVAAVGCCGLRALRSSTDGSHRCSRRRSRRCGRRTARQLRVVCHARNERPSVVPTSRA